MGNLNWIAKQYFFVIVFQIINFKSVLSGLNNSGLSLHTGPCISNAFEIILDGNATLNACVRVCNELTLCNMISFYRQAPLCLLGEEKTFKADGKKRCINILKSDFNDEKLRLSPINLGFGKCENHTCDRNSVCSAEKDDKYMCKRQYCLSETNITHAKFISKLPTKIGHKNNLVCTDGMIGVGENVVTCQTNGSFSTTTNFRCSNACPSLSNNATFRILSISSVRFVENTTVEYDCIYKLYSTDKKVIVCKPTGEWSAMNCPRKCHQAEIPPVPNAHARPGGTYTIYERAEYECDQWSYLKGTPYLSCFENGTWTKPDTECNKYCTRVSLPYLRNGAENNTVDLFTDNMTASYKCYNSSYITGGSTTVQCSPNGDWGNLSLLCSLYCTHLEIHNGTLLTDTVKDVYTKEDSLLFNCFKGTSEYNVTTNCLLSGRWSVTACYCNHTNITNGNITSEVKETYRHQENIIFTCTKEGMYHPKYTSICLGSGGWTETMCYWYCGDPPANAIQMKGDPKPYTTGSRAIYQCEQDGSKKYTLYCHRSGTWVGSRKCK